MLQNNYSFSFLTKHGHICQMPTAPAPPPPTHKYTDKYSIFVFYKGQLNIFVWLYLRVLLSYFLFTLNLLVFCLIG